MGSNKQRFAAILLTGTILTGCQTTEGMGSKEGLGTALGALGGALLGSQLGSGNGQVVGVIAGAAAGAWLGNQIGKSLDEADRVTLANSTEKAFSTGSSQAWSNPETGVSGTVKVKESSTQNKSVKLAVLKDKVQEVPPMEFYGENYQARQNMNVRGGPGTDYLVVDKLLADEVVTVVGKVNNQPWYMISKGGAASGFVHESLMQPSPDLSPTLANNAPPVGAIAETEVAAAQECRVVTQEVTLKDGSTASEDVKACRGPNGWEII